MVNGSRDAKKITDYLDINFLQTLQDHCSKAMGLAFVTVDCLGYPVTKYSGFTPYCQLGRENEGFFEMCKQCDAHGGLQAAITGQPYIYCCHAGLVDFALPIIYDGVYMGSLMGGQIRLNQEEKGGLEHVLPSKTDWNKDKDLDDAYQETQLVSYEKLKSAVALMQEIVLFIMQNGKRKEEAAAKDAPNPDSEMEFAFPKSELATIKSHQGTLHYFFFVMNIISQMAFQEKAKKTEAVAYDFADVMRYVVDSDHEISTLGEELDYVKSLLRIQQAWVGDSLRFDIRASKDSLGLNCPYMVLEPLVGLAVQNATGECVRAVEIAVEDGQDGILVSVASNNEDVTLEELDAMIHHATPKDGISLFEANQSLKQKYGKQAGFFADARKDGHPGYRISFCLPQTKDA